MHRHLALADQVSVVFSFPPVVPKCQLYAFVASSFTTLLSTTLVCERPQQFAGVKALYVHVMAANEAGRAFYSSCGFELEKEETSNQAHYRGHCLDGVEGLGRTVLLKDAFL